MTDLYSFHQVDAISVGREATGWFLIITGREATGEHSIPESTARQIIDGYDLEEQ